MRYAKQLLIEKLTEFASQGMTMRQASEATGMPYISVAKYVREHGIPFKKWKRGPDTCAEGSNERSDKMAALYRSGQTLEQIGVEFGLTRERVRQILRKHYGIQAKHGGARKMAKKNRAAFNAKRDAQSIARWGCSFSQYVVIRDLKKPTRAYAEQRRNAIRRGIDWKLTLWQWWCVWQDSGFWEHRGRGHGYQMCRIGDQGPYSVGNVYIATGAQNIRNYWARKQAEAQA